MTRFLLDTSVLILARQEHYAFEFCPAFWDWLDQQDATGQVKSVESVFLELQQKDDDLSIWASQRGRNFFLEPDSEVNGVFDEISVWIKRQKYAKDAVTRALEGADLWLIAHAEAHGHAVVTHEKSSHSTRKVKIPDICRQRSVPVLDPFEMLHQLRPSFVLGAASASG